MPSALPATLAAYRRLSALAAPLAAPLIARRLKQGKEDPERLGERRGVASVERPPGPLIWIHGASVGEVLAAAGLIERLRALNVRILLTSGTVTSAAIVARRFPPDVIHQYIPFDSPRFVSAFLDHWKPGLALFIESDIWPNLILSSAERRIPMVIINGRMSPRSFPRWQKLRGTISTLLECFDLCLAQSDRDGERFAALGCPNVVTSGNLKLDVEGPPADVKKLERLREATQRRLVFLAASTHPGEDEIILDAHRRLAARMPQLLSVIVPRHPNRGAAIARMLTDGGMQVALRSQDELPGAGTDIYVADTMGELGLFYRLAPVVFMGGSLVAHGGQNPIEGIKLGAAILHGPHVFNFGDIYDALNQAGGAIRAETGEDFVKSLGHLLVNPIARQRSVGAAETVVSRLGGALDKTP
ncbi:MAG TPA: 3-deoxy-D-manno-octulosonic acid transferase, partial [Afipia sp.]|nr:3-deoxy-D-manno-octulosonic acid transferase [Afipia sp.]